jgi:CubicO group peptidase (beta-lactamase class C family)
VTGEPLGQEKFDTRRAISMKDRELQLLVDDTAREFAVVGAQLAIYDGLQVCEFATGERNRELGLAVTADTLFQIGSTTKLLNAALILSLVDAGTLDLDVPVREYVRNFRLADAGAEELVTLRYLLSMTAGLDNGPYFDYGRGDDALYRYVEVLAGIPQVFPPGSAFGYSNASSNVAGYVAQRVTGQTWEQLLIDRLVNSLGLQHFALFAEDLLLHPVALGYSTAAGRSTLARTPTWCLPRSMAPAGGLTCCSAGDLVRFARLMLNRGECADGRRLLSEAAINTMHQPHVRMQTRLFADDWCVGPYRKNWGGVLVYGHSGTNISGSSTLLWSPERNVAAATVVNVADRGYMFADAVFDTIFPEMFGIRKPKTVTPESVTPVPIELEPYVGRFEAFGMIQDFEVEDGTLKLTAKMAVAPNMEVERSELISLGCGRFFPRDGRVSANRNWDMAFWGTDGAGRATHLLQGIFPLRRTG